jgi:hypothetical protein
VGGVDDVQDHVGGEDDVPGHLLLVVERGDAVDPGGVEEVGFAHPAPGYFNGGAGVIGDLGVEAGERAEEEGLADIRVACQDNPAGGGKNFPLPLT